MNSIDKHSRDTTTTTTTHNLRLGTGWHEEFTVCTWLELPAKVMAELWPSHFHGTKLMSAGGAEWRRQVQPTWLPRSRNDEDGRGTSEMPTNLEMVRSADTWLPLFLLLTFLSVCLTVSEFAKVRRHREMSSIRNVHDHKPSETSGSPHTIGIIGTLKL